MSVEKNIGAVTCPFCNESAPVRKNKVGRLYYMCQHCGLIYPNMPGGQDWILSNARMGAPAPEPKPAPAAAPAPKPAPKPDAGWGI